MTVEMNTKLNDDDAVHTLPALNKLDADAARAQPTLDDKLDQELDVEKRSASDESFVDDDGLEELTPAQVKTERRFLWKLDLLLLSWSWFGESAYEAAGRASEADLLPSSSRSLLPEADRQLGTSCSAGAVSPCLC